MGVGWSFNGAVVTSTVPLAGQSIVVLGAISYPAAGPAEGIPIRGADFVKVIP